MKSLPILSAWLVALIGLAWVARDADSMRLLAQAVETVEPESDKPDTAKEDSEPALPPESAEALAVLREARQQLLDRGSVQAKLRETAHMGTRQFHTEGEYVAGPYPKLRLSFKIESGGASAELLEVCDGHILWTVQTLASVQSEEPEVQVARTVIGDVLDAWQETQGVPETDLIAHMGVGGVPSLLAALERAMTFEAFRELESEGIRYSVIQGRWKDNVVNRFKQGDEDEEASLPNYVPDHVRIYFDAETSFPTRIMYLKETAPGSRKFTPLLTLEFSDVVLDGPVDVELFHYTPDETTQVHDRTRDFLQMIQAAEEATDDETATPESKSPNPEK